MPLIVAVIAVVQILADPFGQADRRLLISDRTLPSGTRVVWITNPSPGDEIPNN